MRDEGFRSPYGVLSVRRDADTEAVETAFARRYKQARRERDGDRRRQELNNALETLRDPQRRAEAEVRWYRVPLDPSDRVPDAVDLAGELLPVDLEPPDDPAGEVPSPQTSEVVAQYLATLPEREWPSDRALLRQMVARVAIERLDPWADETAAE